MYDLKIKSYKRNYNVSFSTLIPDLKNDFLSNSFLLIDSNVNDLYPKLSNYFKDKSFIIESCEENKTLNYCQKIICFLLEKGIKKNFKIIAIGGGIVQDIAGFISSVLFRGIEWFFFPTTLLSQADSCIGSKTSINFMNTKNLLGTFYPPSKIICCTEFLNTLNDDEIKSGIGEILHYYLYDNSDKIMSIVENYDLFFENKKLLLEHIYESLKIKKTMIENDEFDTGPRRVFNYGHTFGHAIEIISNFDVPHGQAVTLGMDIANFVSLSFGIINVDMYLYFKKILQKNMPNFKLSYSNLDLFMKTLSKDKKNINNSIVCILPYGIGDVRVHEIKNTQELRQIIFDYVKGQL